MENMDKVKITVNIPRIEVLNLINSKEAIRDIYAFKLGENKIIVPKNTASSLLMLSFSMGFIVTIDGYTIKDERDVYPPTDEYEPV